MKGKKIKLIWIIIPLVIIGAVAEFLFFFGDKIFAAPLPEGFIFCSGRIDTRVVDASSKIGGRVDEIFVREGERLDKGQLIARISPLELDAQIKNAEANIDLLLSRQSQARVDLDMANDQVNTGIQQAEAGIAVAEANLSKTQSRYQQADIDFQRAEQLFTTGAIPRRRWEETKLLREIAEKQVKVAEKTLDEARISLQMSQDLKKRLKAKEFALAGLLKMTTAARAQRELLEVQLKEMAVYSPCSGIVLDRIIDPGEILSPGIPVVTLINPEEMFLRVYLNTGEMSQVKLGDEAKIYPDGLDNVAINAKITRISDMAEFTPKNVETKDQRTNLVFEVRLGNFEDHEAILKSGMSAEVVIKTAVDKSWEAVKH